MKHRSISTFRKLRPNASRFQSDLPTERSCKKRSTVFNDPCEAERRIKNCPRRRGESSIERRRGRSALRVAPWTTRQSTSYGTLPSACAPGKVGCLRTVGKWHRKVANKQIAREEKTGNTQKKNHVSYAVRALLYPFRHGVWLITLPAGGVCLAHRPLSLKTCGQKVKTPLILHKISGVFFAPAQLGGKVCAARGRSSALVRAIARATLTRGAQQTVLPQFCTTKSENRDFSC